LAPRSRVRNPPPTQHKRAQVRADSKQRCRNIPRLQMCTYASQKGRLHDTIPPGNCAVTTSGSSLV
jgi:hypothetical protein